MVYCGKPSKSCRQCRNRNIKCDKKRPACGQCLRATLTCPGYHDPSKVQIRDETSVTIHRVFNQQMSSHQSHFYLPNIDIIDKAKCLFVSTHVFGEHPSFPYLKNFFPPKLSDDFLINSVQAVSLLYLGNHAGSYEVVCKARMKYSAALVAMGKALGKQGQATRKEVLVTVLLMDCFEKLSKDEPKPIAQSSAAPNRVTSPPNEKTSQYKDRSDAEVEGESKHLVGALALCKLRGLAQFNDPVSVAMFHHLSRNILSSCLKRGVTLPADYIQFRTQVSASIPASDEKWRAENLLIDFIDFKSKLETRNIDHEEAQMTMEGLQREYRELCTVFMPETEKGPNSKNPTSESPIQGRNNFCSVRELMDGIFEDCHGMMLKRQMVDGSHKARLDEILITL
ncbi:hypothetical protein EG329_011814 [Mollisiaceae sp. DMI_Dod_QoI]|nr:hypothetical protein EG329_011814 [Helotiales sp. DMI_Dod_QoI]